MNTSFNGILKLLALDSTNRESLTDINLDIYSHRKKTIIYLSVYFFIPVLLIFAGLNLIQKNYTELLITSLSICICMMGVFLLKKFKCYLSLVRTNLAIMGLLFLFSIQSEDVSGAAIFWVFIYPLITFYLLGPKEGLTWCLTSFLLYVFLILDPGSIFQSASYSFEIKTRFLGSYTLITIMSYIFEKSRHEFVNFIKLVNISFHIEIQQRKQAEMEINHAKEKLEQQVKNRTQELVIINEELDVEIKNKIRIEKELIESKKKLNMILGNMHDGYFETDANGNLSNYNNTFQELMGFGNSQNLKGKSLRELVGENESAKVTDYFARNMETDTPYVILGWKKFGKAVEKKYWEGLISQVKWENGSVSGYRGLIKDVGESRFPESLTTKIKKAKDDFMNRLSYQIRMSMHHISGLSNLGISKIATMGKPEMLDLFIHIASNCIQLQKQIDDLFYISNLDTDRGEYLFQNDKLPDQLIDVLNKSKCDPEVSFVDFNFRRPVDECSIVGEKNNPTSPVLNKNSFISVR